MNKTRPIADREKSLTLTVLQRLTLMSLINNHPKSVGKPKSEDHKLSTLIFQKIRVPEEDIPRYEKTMYNGDKPTGIMRDLEAIAKTEPITVRFSAREIDRLETILADAEEQLRPRDHDWYDPLAKQLEENLYDSTAPSAA